MVNSNNLDEILTSYILNESGTQQELFVRNWLSKSEANRLYFEQLVKTLGLVAAVGKKEDIDIENEWKIFVEGRVAYENSIKRKQIDEFKTELPYRETSYSGRSYKMFFAAAVAVCILVMVSLGLKYFLVGKGAEQPMASSENTTPVTNKKYERHEVNNSGSSKKIALSDGSIITLSRNSEVRFSEPFVGSKRDIYLIGRAGFKVAKESSKPFSVYTGDITTTALGTEFTVTAYKYAKNITVRLYEGKVVVKSLKTARVRLKKDLYLNPGQELIYNKSNAAARITSFQRPKVHITEPDNKIDSKVTTDNPNIPLHDAGSWFMFNNQSLDQVFNQLEGLYNVEIVYDKRDLQKMYFIGKFEKADSLQNVLKLITSLNGLVCQKKDNRYFITRQK